MRPFAQSILLALVCAAASAASEPLVSHQDFDKPPHHYRSRAPQDRFTRSLPEILKEGRLDRSSEKAFVLSLLELLEVPPSSQLLVFSTTSLQLRFISPSNPRALYFNEDIYIGYIPGGRLEVIGIDPELGAIFYIFDVPRQGELPRFERSDRCMNCHAGEETGFLPGLLAKSVIPGPTGGTLDAFRTRETGHGIPLRERFGGWHVTTQEPFTNHWGNLIGRFVNGELRHEPNPAGVKFSWDKYLAPGSDILPHLIHEHQIGFVNRAVEAGYRARTAEFLAKGAALSLEREAELDEQARALTRYILFVDEAPLPRGGIKPDLDYARAFLANRQQSAGGASLKDLDLKTRLFRHRCSYMIHSAAFQGLPTLMKSKVFSRLRRALAETSSDGAHLPASEKSAIRAILKDTCPELTQGW